MQDDEQKDLTNEYQDDINSKKEEIEDRQLPTGGIMNALRNPITAAMNKAFGGENKRDVSFSKLAPNVFKKYKLVFIGFAIFLVLIIAIVIKVGDDASESAVKTRTSAVSDFNIDESSSIVEKEALKLYENYDSLIGFTDAQLDKIYQNLKDNEDARNRYLIQAGSREFGFGLDKYSVNYKRTLYEHIQRTEKYNFNQVIWKEFTHDVSDKLLEKEERTDLGLLVPKNTDDETLVTILDTTAPYLLTNDIPLGMLSGTYGVANSSLKDTSTATEFVYQLLKESLTKMTVHKYVLKSLKYNTAYEEYDTFHYKGTYTAKYQNGQVYLVSAPNYQLVQEPTHVLTDERKVSGDTIKEDTYWYVVDAQTYDANIKNEFEHKVYSDEDAANIRNPDSTVLINTTEINNIYGDGKITDTLPENLKANVVNSVFTAILEGREEDPGGGYTFTFETEYYQDLGTSYTYEKEWKDTATPKVSDNKVFTYDDLVAYNTTKTADIYKDIPSDKKVIDESEFKDNSVSLKRLEDEDKTIGLYGMSIIDFMDANENIYLKYVNSKSADVSKVEGLGRYKLREGYNQIKYIFDQMLKETSSETLLPFVYGSSLGYDVTSISYMPAYQQAVSGTDLLRLYIQSHEGNGAGYGGGMFDENLDPTDDEDAAKYYKVYDAKDGVYTVGYGVNINRHFEKVKNALAEVGTEVSSIDDISYGMYLDKTAIDKVKDMLIDEFVETVKAETNGIELTEYQIHALASRAYVHGTTNVGNDKPFKNYYTQYWNQENDDKYDELYEKYKDNQTASKTIRSEIDFTHKLFTECMDIYVSQSFDSQYPGYEVRQKSEFTLFSGGYYDTLQKFWTQGAIAPNGANLTPNGQIDEAACLSLQQWFEQNWFSGRIAADMDLHSASFSQKVTDIKDADSRGVINPEVLTKYSTPVENNYIFECAWWSCVRANAFLIDNNTGKKIPGMPDGRKSAKHVADTLGLHYNTNSAELRPNSVISYDRPGSKSGHTAYVEAVTDTHYIISECGSGWYWEGIHILPKDNGSGTYTFVGFTCLEDLLQ